MMRRTRVALVLTAAGLAIGLAVVGLAVVAVVAFFNTGFFGLSCTPSDHDFGERLAEDAAVRALSDAYPIHEPPQHGCDEDDRTVSVDVEFVTGVSKSEALSEGSSLMQASGWTASNQRPGCFDKQIDGRDVMADLKYLSEFRTNKKTDLLISLVRMPMGCQHN